MSQEAIETLLAEDRTFPPSEAFTAQANLNDEGIYERAAADPVAFWEEQAKTFEWMEPWSQVLDWQPPFAKWFVGGKLNLTFNCLDRHVNAGLGDKVAFHWEGEPGDTKTLTYSSLLKDVSTFANGLKKLGVGKGDRVTLYMGMVPELVVSMLACARIGAAHSIVFGGFSPDSLKERIKDSESKVVVTCDGSWRRGSPVSLKKNTDAAVAEAPTVEKVIVVPRLGDKIETPMVEGRDHWWDDVIEGCSDECAPEPMDAEDLLFILYTSGTTGKPKGIAHTTGGYMVGAGMTTKWVFDIKPDDVYWCTADIGWVTGHSYITYGPLLNAATSVMFEGAPNYPDEARFWQIVEKYKVTVFYTAPTAIRAFMRWGDEHPKKHDLSSLRLLGSVGEPINPEAWMWYHEVIGGERCPIVDTWWQTETGSIMIAPLPGLTTTKPGSATRALPGIAVDVVDENGESVPKGGGGFLVLRKPWPSMLRTVFGDDQRYRDVYWSKFDNLYFAGDGAKRDEDGYLWLLGRVDDIMLVSGHNISTMEVESACVDHDDVAEAAVVGRTHEIKGQAIAAFVTLKKGVDGSDDKNTEIRKHVSAKLGPICRPDELYFAPELPKTRSGKIMRRLLRDIAEGRELGDTTTLADPTVVDSLRQQYEAKHA
ncbi:MAG: acetate--CoA ligase [Planctomycetota bacterium]|nr:acetate--CoA ligase [Planctomycetota bacterium]